MYKNYKVDEEYFSSKELIKESLNNLTSCIKSELSAMNRMDLIHKNPGMFKEVLDSITENNKEILKFIDFLN
jgi:hypothetical protein